MFGGIIECKGFIYFTSDNDLYLYVQVTEFTLRYFKNVKVGQSIALNGICLTVREIHYENRITVYFYISEETKLKTTLVHQSWVNVERPLVHGEYLGGHYVQGHVHERGTLISVTKIKDAYDLIFTPTHWNSAALTYKNSIAINGVSLTISFVDEENNQFGVAMIPHTAEETTFKLLFEDLPADVNLEFNQGSFAPLVAPPHKALAHKAGLPVPGQWTLVGPDEIFMMQALQLAKRGTYTTPPNPSVGCVIVKESVVIGEGHHERPGLPHAEICAIQNAQEVRGATLYVTLEPCHHFGRTGPCDEEIIRQGIARVVVGVLDPDKRVSGQGIARLREAGIQVDILDASTKVVRKIEKMMRAYLHHRRTGLPLVTGKIALSLDGAIQDASGKSQWISSEDSRKHAHTLRAQCQAIIVGSKTACWDQPRLNVRLNDLNVFPLRVVIDSQGVVPHKGPLFDLGLCNNQPTLVFTTNPKLQSSNVCTVIQQSGGGSGSGVGSHKVNLRQVLEYLATQCGVLRCLVEGGAELQAAFTRAGLMDELFVYSSSKILGKSSTFWGSRFLTTLVDEEPTLKIQKVSLTPDGDVIKRLRRGALARPP